MCCWKRAGGRKKAATVRGSPEGVTGMKEEEAEFQSESLIPGLPEDIALVCLARVPVTSLWGVCREWQLMLSKSSEFKFARQQQGKSELNWLYTLVHRSDGRYEWNAFDPLMEKWHPLPNMPESVDFQLTTPGSIGLSHSIQCVSTKSKLVMLAGLKPSTSKAGQNWSQLEPALNEPWIFNPNSCVWTKGTAIQSPRKWCVCGVVNERVYVASGCGQQWDMSLSKRSEVYDLDSDSWTLLPNLESSKFSGEAITAVNVEGKLHMVSGRGVFVKEGAIFCPVTSKWSKMPPGLRKGWIGSCVSINDRFYMIDEDLGKLSVYNKATDSWTTVLEDTKMKNLTNIVASDGKIFGVVKSEDSNAETDGSTLRVVDLTTSPPSIYTQRVPHGRVVSLQILARMNGKRGRGSDCAFDHM
ncbi:hypothetical protein R1sor_004787 [Riccia sorocarpa]|uniref:F-box/kelch-repeat protein n=1 Tax=Riccia sorocarpa TaxID=122646 RepID=A0ABD3HLZ7_9MARC